MHRISSTKLACCNGPKGDLEFLKVGAVRTWCDREVTCSILTAKAGDKRCKKWKSKKRESPDMQINLIDPLVPKNALVKRGNSITLLKNVFVTIMNFQL